MAKRDTKGQGTFAQLYDVQEKTIPFEDAIAPYISEEDKKYIQSKTNKATHLLSLQSKQLRNLKEKGLIWEFSFLEMEKMLVELFTFQGRNERIKNFPYPRQFATLNLFFVWIFIILLPFGIMTEFDQIGNEVLLKMAQGMRNPGLRAWYQALAQNFVWISVPFSVIISWIFHTMERIGEVSENPFEGGPNDIPITSMSRGIEIDIRQMLDEEGLPAPVEAVNTILM